MSAAATLPYTLVNEEALQSLLSGLREVLEPRSPRFKVGDHVRLNRNGEIFFATVRSVKPGRMYGLNVEGGPKHLSTYTPFPESMIEPCPPYGTMENLLTMLCAGKWVPAPPKRREVLSRG